MHFVALQHKTTETKMKNNSFAWHMGTGRQAYHKPRQARREERKEREKERGGKMWFHHVCKWECRRRLRHPRRFFEIWCTSALFVQHMIWDWKISLLPLVWSAPTFKRDWPLGASSVANRLSSEIQDPSMSFKLTFASNYIRIRAFCKAISRSCILLRFHTNNQRKMMINICFDSTYRKRLKI